MTKNHNTGRLRQQVAKVAENAFTKNRGYVIVRLSLLDELLDVSDAYDDLVRDLVEAVKR